MARRIKYLPLLLALFVGVAWATFDSDNFDTDNFSTSSFEFGGASYFPGTYMGDGGHIWPARANDPRWDQIISDSGITPSGNFQDDVKKALEAVTGQRGHIDTLWDKFKTDNGVTDVSEPFLY